MLKKFRIYSSQVLWRCIQASNLYQCSNFKFRQTSMTSASSSLSNKVTRSINVINKQLSYHECMTSVASTIQKVVVCRRVHDSANTLPANAPGTTPAPPDEGLLSKHVAFPRTSHGAAVVYDAPGTAIPGRYEACIFEICGHFSRLTEERTWNTCCLLGNLTLNDCGCHAIFAILHCWTL